MSGVGKERYIALHGGVWVENPRKGPGQPGVVLIKTGDVVELFPHDAERINRNEGLRLAPYQNGHLVPVRDADGNPTGETKNAPKYVKDTAPRLVPPAEFQKRRDAFEAAKKQDAAETTAAKQRIVDEVEVA